ncbi:VOC family protein [Cohnella sp. GCM10020058]|uniref:VOC family protein n=1 Tax=Cohnella sp. GCM10020058 TaxID=3317330 RepID=UPI003628F9A6
MSDGWKPKGYSSVSPYLVVPDAQRVINFLQEAFGANELRRYLRPDGSVMHVEVQIEDTIVMLGEATEKWEATVAQLHIYVEDVRGTYQQAVHAGGVSVMEPARRAGDPDRRAGVKDPAGNTWWIATQES